MSFSSCLLAVASSDDQTVGFVLLGTGLDTHESSAPRRSRSIVTDRVLTFTTTMRMVVRVHDGTTDGRTFAEPSGSTGLTLGNKVVVFIADSADGSSAGEKELSDFAGSESEGAVFVFLTKDLGRSTSCTADLSALARFKFDIVDSDTFRNVGKLHAVADGDFAGLSVSDGHADSQALRADDVSLLAMSIDDQGDTAVSVRVIFDGLDDRGGFAVSLEVDDTVHPLVATTDVTAGDVALIVSAASLLERLHQRFFRSFFREIPR